MEETRVAVVKVNQDPPESIRDMFKRFPDIQARLAKCRTVFIKVNAVYFHPHLYTSEILIDAVIKYIRQLDQNKLIYVMDNCSQGNFTRLCFAATGIDKVVKKNKARCLYLDEAKSVNVALRRSSDESYQFPEILYRHLINNRKDAFYLNMPVLKAHCQAQLTAGLKNQMGLLYDEDRARYHNHLLHQKIVDIYHFIQPDFTLLDAIKVLSRGPMPAGKYVQELLHEKNVIIGGNDTVAVDAVAAKVLGHEPHHVKHIKLAAEQNLGRADISDIVVLGKIPPAPQKIPWEFKSHLPESIRFVIGKEGACYEGCVGHAEQVLELVVNEAGSPEKLAQKPLTIVAGKGLMPSQIENLTEPIMLLGQCACSEAGAIIRKKYRKVDLLDTCGRCDNILSVSLKRLGISPFALSPISPYKVMYHFIVGKLNGLKYTLP